MNVVYDLIADGLFAAIAGMGFGAISDPPLKAFPSIGILAALGHALRYALMSLSLGQRLGAPFLAGSRGYDHNYVLDQGTAAAAELWCPRTGIGLELHTTLPGMQLYTAGFLTERTGKSGAVYGPHHAVCLEPQFFPDAVNHDNFPSPVLKAGAEYHQTIRYRFFVR